MQRWFFTTPWLLIVSTGFAQTWAVHDLKRPQPEIVHARPQVSLPAPPGATVLFDGSDLSAWRHDDGADARWKIENGELVVTPGSGNLQTRAVFDDVQLHVEWMVPESEAQDQGQNRGNSGVFLMGLYEIQVLESLGSTTYADGMAGSVYGQFPPAVNPGSGIGRWNSYDIFFRSPRFEDSKVVEPASVTVLHNGYTIQDGRELLGVTRHQATAEYHLHAPRLPLVLQDHGDPIHFRNIWIRDLPRWDELPKTNRAGRLRQHVEFLAGLDPARSSRSPGSLLFAAQYIAESLRQAGWAVHFQDYDADGVMQRNVVARLGPDAGSLLVVGAHYDCVDGTPGADDNASGVAGLIELAGELAKRPMDRPIELVAYTLEEPPFFGTDFMGSVVHAKSLKEAETEVEGMISLEMIGCYTDRPDSQRYPVAGMETVYPNTGNFLAVVSLPKHREWLDRFATALGGSMKLPVETLAAPTTVTGIDFSDHRSYWAEGYPALMLTDTAFFRSIHYHEASDTPATLDYLRMAEVVDGLFGALAPASSD